jgi:3-phenylpropionate/trans-cinnamate dioxygenase ferredoxin reductase component
MKMKDVRPMVIIGAGHVGGRAAQALREFGWEGEIVLVGDEPHLPYERPPLSKAVLTGEQEVASLHLRPAADYDSDAITHVRTAAVSIDTERHAVKLADGRELVYASLLLATGGHARRLTIPGHDLPGVMTLRTINDAAALALRLRADQHIVVVGGGFIGLEVAASARQRGCRVTLLEGAPRLMGRAVPAAVAEQMLAVHRARGVDVRIGCGPTVIEADGERLAVSLQDGSRVVADTVIVGIGIAPATALAQAAGLRVNSGVVVDALLATSAPGVYAAGDVAEFPGSLSGLPMRQETWHNAETQARTAARNMLGGSEPYAALPWFWSDQYDHQLQVSGEPALGVQTVERKLGDGAQIHFALDAGGKVVGASGCGPTGVVVRELKLARMLVERGARPDAGKLADPAVKLKSLLAG